MNNHIKEYWDKNAEKFQNSHWVSWGNKCAIQLEIDNVSNYIKDNDKVLDVGCANGFAAFEQFNRKNIEIHGIDFSEKMIEIALKIKNEQYQNRKVFFKHGNILDIDYPDNSFDLVYTTRVLINLPTWEEQITGIIECIRVAKKGGIVILSEAFWEPLVLLNSIRLLKNLPSLVEHDFNRYLKKEKLDRFLQENNIPFENIDFSSIYYLGSRFIRELVTKTEEFPGYSNPINEIFFNIEKDFSGGGFGIQQAYIIKK